MNGYSKASSLGQPMRPISTREHRDYGEYSWGAGAIRARSRRRAGPSCRLNPNRCAVMERRLSPQQSHNKTASSAVATGLITFALQQTGMSTADPMMKQGLLWLSSNQNKEDGSWPSFSINERRKASSNIGHFMRVPRQLMQCALSENSGAPSQGSVAENRSGENPDRVIRNRKKK
jgi:hypothetical protein